MGDNKLIPRASTSKYSAISSSSFLDLKAELSKREDDFSKSRSLGESSTITGGIKRGLASKSSTNGSTSWLKSNAGIQKRQERDRIVYEADVGGKHNPDMIKKQLERKALLYDKIRKGKSGGLEEAQIQNLLVDFDRKNWDNPDASSESDSSEGEDESATVPVRPLESDPLVDWTDEFGRTRQIPRSEVPRGQLLPDSSTNEEHPAESANVIYGDQHHFPVYAPDPAVLAARKAALLASQTPLETRYDASLDNRVRGAASYTFSKDEEERQRQMEALKVERERTEREREGKREREDKGGVEGEREREKLERKRKIEEKRREMAEKRKKV